MRERQHWVCVTALSLVRTLASRIAFCCRSWPVWEALELADYGPSSDLGRAAPGQWSQTTLRRHSVVPLRSEHYTALDELPQQIKEETHYSQRADGYATFPTGYFRDVGIIHIRRC